jgi:hypothetical protein
VGDFEGGVGAFHGTTALSTVAIRKINQKGYVLLLFLSIFPIMAGLIGAVGAGSLLVSNYRKSLGICRDGILNTVAPLEQAAKKIVAMNAEAKNFIRQELAIRARLAACTPVPLSCIEPAAKMARLQVKMFQFNQKRKIIRQKGETAAEFKRRNLIGDLLSARLSLLKSETPIALVFDKFPPLVTTPIFFTGAHFEKRNRVRQFYLFYPLQYVPHWLRQLLGRNIIWNPIPLQCSASLKAHGILPPTSGLSGDKP